MTPADLAYLFAALGAVVGAWSHWIVVRLRAAPPARPPSITAYLQAVIADERREHADVVRLLAGALPRLSSRLAALSSPHDLESEARFVVEVREALDGLHYRLPRTAAPIPLAVVSEPVILIKDEA